MLKILINIGVGSAKQRLYERLEMLRPIFQDGPDVVSKQIATSFNGATGRARTISSCRKGEGFVEAHIAVKFAGDSKHVVDINRNAASPAVQRKPANDVAVLWIEPHVGVLHRDFYLCVILGEGRRSKQQSNSYKDRTSYLHFLPPQFHICSQEHLSPPRRTLN